MKNLLFKRHIDLKKGVKSFSICSRTEDQECKTQVQKSFTYAIDWVGESIPRQKRPIVFIRKSFNTKSRVETFGFHVKGYFCITHKSDLVKVRFHHTLDIEIKWKIKEFSSKKPVSLT